MTRQILIIFFFVGLIGILSCNNKIQSIKTDMQQLTMTIDTLKVVLDAFNRHDLDAIMEYFSDDCSFDFPRGSEPFGQRFIGKA